MHRPGNQAHWDGHGVYSDENGRLRLTDITLRLTGTGLVLHEGQDITLIRVPRPR